MKAKFKIIFAQIENTPIKAVIFFPINNKAHLLVNQYTFRHCSTCWFEDRFTERCELSFVHYYD